MFNNNNNKLNFPKLNITYHKRNMIIDLQLKLFRWMILINKLLVENLMNNQVYLVRNIYQKVRILEKLIHKMLQLLLDHN